MARFACAARGNDRNGHGINNGPCELDLVTVLGSVGIDGIQTNFPGPQILRLLCPPEGIDPGKNSAAMNDDFGTVEAVAVLFELALEVNKTGDIHLAGCLKTLAGIIGLLQREPAEFLQGGAASDGLSNAAIDALIEQRKQARADKNWAESDRIRDVLNAENIILEDGAGGTTWRRG